MVLGVKSRGKRGTNRQRMKAWRKVKERERERGRETGKEIKKKKA